MQFVAELVFDKTYELNKHAVPAGDWIIEGYASTSDLDAQNHIVSPEAIKMGAESLIKYNTVLFNHDPDRPIGKIVKTEAQDTKLWMKVSISKTEPKLWEQVKDGTLSKFSIRGKILDSEYYTDERSITQKEILVIKAMELHEVSLVSVPANPEAKSLSWYIEKALEAQKSGKCSDCKDDVEKKVYRNPGESMSDCVQRKTKANIAEGMAPKQAVAAAYSMCRAKKDLNQEEIEAFVEAVLAISPELTVEKNQKNFESAIASLKAGLSVLKGEDKDQVQTMIRTLQALIGRVYQKSLDEEKGGLPVETVKKDEKPTTEEVKKSDEPEAKKEDVKKSDEPEVKKEEVEVKKDVQATVDVSALVSVISQLQSLVKDANSAVEAANKGVTEIAKAKEDVSKVLADLNEAMKSIPVRKGASPEPEEDRTKETVIEKKSVTETEEFKKMRPDEQLHALISQSIK